MMAEIRPVGVLSSEDQDVTLLSPGSPKRKSVECIEAPLLIIDDDDLTPYKSTPSFVSDTPLSNLVELNSSFVKCTTGCAAPGTSTEQKFSGIAGLICLESDNESEGTSHRDCSKENDTVSLSTSASSLSKGSQNDYIGLVMLGEKEAKRSTNDWDSLLFADHKTDAENKVSSSILKSVSYGDNDAESKSKLCFGDSNQQTVLQIIEDNPTHNSCSFDTTLSMVQTMHEKVIVEQLGDAAKQKDVTKAINIEKKRRKVEQAARKEQQRMEKKDKREQEMLQREALKAEAAKMKKLQKEQEKWEKGKFALESIVAEIDTKVVEAGSVGGYLLTRFAEKGITFRVTTNPIERTVLWKMHVPDQIFQSSSTGLEVQYILLVYAAEEFCDLVNNNALLDQITRVQSCYPSYTICCLTSKLMAYINKREQIHYKNPLKFNSWRRPPVEEVLSKIATHYERVHSRQCVDEAEVADHVVGLTCALATCHFRKKLTKLSVNANGSFIPKNFIDKHLIRQSTWLKVLIAIPKVQPRFAVAIWRKYPTMRSLLNTYLDPSKSVHEKEFLLKDLLTEGALGQEERRVGEICSKRIYRILMAQSGNIITDDVEDGADFFHN
ncbi:crossover junction endonuclease EME1B [Aristolochia californica]|uniref:crossover junction endonuclease EME1B n=1 Tax=Aristolochia californica TaxID=171875 RepID=UPI0035D8315E